MAINELQKQTNTNIQEKANLIWESATHLVGLFKPHEYGKVILPLTVLKRFDDALAPTKQAVLEMKKKLDASNANEKLADGALTRTSGYAFYNTSKFDFAKLLADPDNIADNFDDYLKGFSSNVADIIENFEFSKTVDTMVKGGVLFVMIQEFNSSKANMSPDKITSADMGYIFEELIRKFSESYDEQAGAHFTSRDIIYLMTELLVAPEKDEIKENGCTKTAYDMAMGTSQMLGCLSERLADISEDADLTCFGQEFNPETYAIAKSDMLIKGGNASGMMYGDTLSQDKFTGYEFDYIISNPPFGIDWKREKAEVEAEAKKGFEGRFGPGLPAISDGQMLFMLNGVKKLKEGSGRMAIIQNGSSLFTGDAGSGESNARRYLIENDLVEAIIAVPENMFYNTGIGTYIWILSNKKEERRKGKIQLIDATAMKSTLRKNMGKKNCEFTSDIRKEIVRIFLDMEESDISMIFHNEEFGYWNVTVERPLRLRVFPDRAIPSDAFKKADEMASVCAAVERAAKTAPLDDWTAFAKATKLKAAQLKKIRPYITEKDPTAQPIDEPDVDLRDTENIPFTYEGGIDGFIEKEVHPYAPDAYVDEKKAQIGYEISFTKYFYKPVELRDMSEILADLAALDKEADGVLAGIMEGIQ